MKQADKYFISAQVIISALEEEDASLEVQNIDSLWQLVSSERIELLITPEEWDFLESHIYKNIQNKEVADTLLSEICTKIRVSSYDKDKYLKIIVLEKNPYSKKYLYEDEKNIFTPEDIVFKYAQSSLDMTSFVLQYFASILSLLLTKDIFRVKISGEELLSDKLIASFDYWSAQKKDLSIPNVFSYILTVDGEPLHPSAWFFDQLVTASINLLSNLSEHKYSPTIVKLADILEAIIYQGVKVERVQDAQGDVLTGNDEIRHENFIDQLDLVKSLFTSVKKHQETSDLFVNLSNLRSPLDFSESSRIFQNFISSIIFEIFNAYISDISNKNVLLIGVHNAQGDEHYESSLLGYMLNLFFLEKTIPRQSLEYSVDGQFILDIQGAENQFSEELFGGVSDDFLLLNLDDLELIHFLSGLENSDGLEGDLIIDNEIILRIYREFLMLNEVLICGAELLTSEPILTDEIFISGNEILISDDGLFISGNGTFKYGNRTSISGDEISILHDGESFTVDSVLDILPMAKSNDDIATLLSNFDGSSGLVYLLSGWGDRDGVVGGTHANEQLKGHAGNDKLFGGAGDDELLGENGDDQLGGGTGDDWLKGGAGNDGLVGNDGNDWLEGGAGNDWLMGDDGNEDLEAKTTNYGLFANEDNDRLSGGAGDDGLFGGAGRDQLLGDTGNDWLFGGAGDDELWGGSDDDELRGQIGNDELSGNEGNDELLGGRGDDRLWGHQGNDVLWGHQGDDVLWGGTDDDELWGGTGDDELWGGRGEDVLWGSTGDDELWGSTGDDGLWGGTGNDVLWSEAGDDFLSGGAGDDVLSGGAGNDLFSGSVGDDVFIGGQGADVFVLAVEEGIDVIVDFEVGIDSIQLFGSLTFEDLSLRGNSIVAFGETLAIIQTVTADELKDISNLIAAT